jgi:hypothetical protein
VEGERGGWGIRSSQCFLLNLNVWGYNIGFWKRIIFQEWRSKGFIVCGGGRELVALIG